MARIDRYPESTADTYYINMGSSGDGLNMSLDDLLTAAKIYFSEEGSVDLSKIEITTEYIHTRCIGYDLYDSGDYDLYIILRKK